MLLRGAASTSTGVRLIGVGEEVGLGLGLSPPSNSRITADGRSVDLDTASVSSAQNANSQDPERSRIAGRRVWIRAAEMLVKCGMEYKSFFLKQNILFNCFYDDFLTGAHWDVNWQTNKGCNQLHLLLSAFPPSRDDSATYRKLLKSCLDSGIDSSVQEERGRSALFILCEQMATVGSETCPDAPRLVHLLLSGANGSHSSSAARKMVNAADRTGRTVFDIVERADHSCLAACRAVLRDASQGALHQDGSSYGAVVGHGHSSSSSRRAGGGEWELDRHNSTSALIARVSQVSGSGSSAYGGDAKRRTASAAGSVSSAAAGRVTSNTSYHNTSSSYLSEDYTDAQPIPLLRGSERPSAQQQQDSTSSSHYGSSYYSPAVARRSSRPYDENP